MMILNKKGFTVIELLFATLLFAVGAVVFIKAPLQSKKVSKMSSKYAVAAELIELKMTELELKFQEQVNQQGVEASFAKLEGTFEKPNEGFSWKAEFSENTMTLSPEVVKKYLVGLGAEERDVEDQLKEQALMLTNINKALKENLGELFFEVSWKVGKRVVKVPIVTHIMLKKPKISFTTKVDEDSGSSND